MERLTTDTSFCEFSLCDADPEVCGTCDNQKRWARLQAYEQTGLEPETIRGVVQSILNLEAVKGFDYLKSLVDADAEGRLLTLPAKLGDKVYTIAFENCLGGKCCWLEDGKCSKAASPEYCPQEVIEQTFSLSLLRLYKNIYTTREEAEAALKKGEPT